MARYKVEMTYSVTFTSEVDAPNQEHALDMAKQNHIQHIVGARGAGCVMSDFHAERMR